MGLGGHDMELLIFQKTTTSSTKITLQAMLSVVDLNGEYSCN